MSSHKVGAAMERLQRIAGHIPAPTHHKASCCTGDVAMDSAGPNTWVREVHWNGWGYKDTAFALNDKGQVELRGNRYLFSGKALPELRKWMEEKVGLDINMKSPSQAQMKKLPDPIRNEEFLKEIDGQYNAIKFTDEERIYHCHGQTAREMWNLRYGSFDRYPDVVIYPSTHEHVQSIVSAAHEHGVVIVPFGGGTTVSEALALNKNEKRMIVSLDMHHMNKILSIDNKSMLVTVQAGIVGKELERQLNQYGVCVGHEPDSMEFSTVGGWISTRASGMRKNRYGNIEDIAINIKMVTPQGTIQKGCNVPRISCGPDINEFLLGSEGMLGVITEVVLKLRPMPETTVYGSIVFPDFESGVACLQEIGIKRLQPVSIRLVDNMQFQFGQALKPENHSISTKVIDKIKKWYVVSHKGFDPSKMVAATLLFEGTPLEVREKERAVYDIATKYGGMKAGSENGVRGYFLTYMIAYLRDFGYNFKFMSESFETSVPWENVFVVCESVKKTIRDEAARLGVQGTPFVSTRVTQLYDTGAAVYFYLGFVWEGLADPVGTFAQIETKARNEIIRLGGCISHHHGVGKHRKQWVVPTIGETGVSMIQAVKEKMDPNNVFACGNFLPNAELDDGHH